MTQLKTEQLIEIYKKLPQDLVDAMFEVDTSNLIRDIGEKHKLNVDKMGELADETGLVMIGITHPNKFISNLTQRLEVDKQKAREIAEDINNNVFKKIRESLKKIHNIRDEEKTKAMGFHEDSPWELPKGESSGKKIESRAEILEEIEKEETLPPPKNKPNEPEKIPEKMTEPPVPDILKGSTTPAEEQKEEEKPPPPPPVKEKQKYQTGADPYREPVE